MDTIVNFANGLKHHLDRLGYGSDYANGDTEGGFAPNPFNFDELCVEIDKFAAEFLRKK